MTPGLFRVALVVVALVAFYARQPRTQPVTSGSVRGPSIRQRIIWVLIVMILVGVASGVLITFLPVLGLETVLKQDNSDLGSDETKELGVKLVLNSTSIWFIAFGGGLSLVSFIAGAISRSNGWATFICNHLCAVASATFVAVAGFATLIKTAHE